MHIHCAHFFFGLFDVVIVASNYGMCYGPVSINGMFSCFVPQHLGFCSMEVGRIADMEFLQDNRE